MPVRIPNLLLASLAACLLVSWQAAAQARRGASTPAPRATPAPSAAPRAPGAGKPLGGAPAARPGRAAELDRWNKMSPQERQRVLNSLPPDRRKRLEERLQTYNQLSPAEQQKLRQQYNAFRQLPPVKQETLRKLYKEFEQLPPARREQLRSEVQQLRNMSPADRRARVSNTDFRTKYTLSEQRVMEDLARVLSKR